VFYGLRAQGLWQDEVGTNLLDTGAPFYDVYTAADGGYLAVGALEPQFYAALLRGLGLADEKLPAQYDRDGWPMLRARFAEMFATRSRDDWAAHFEGTDACVAPVLSFAEAPRHPHLTARQTFIEVDGVVQPAPAPRFSRTVAAARPSVTGPDGPLAAWGFSPEQVAGLRAAGAVA
jgi:alpha-methylacyl-CoA racemase